MIETLASSWLAYAVLVIVTAVSRMRCGSWFAPAAYVGLIWSFFIGVSLRSSSIRSPEAACGCWSSSSLRFNWSADRSSDPAAYPPLRSPGMVGRIESLIIPCRRYGVICAAAALAGCAYFLFISLEEFGLPFTWIGVLGVGARWTLLRYTDVMEPWPVRIAVTWLHPAALLGGFVCL